MKKKVKAKYKLVLDNYLMWRSDDCNTFRPPEIEQLNSALSPEIIMLQWESEGVKVPSTCTNPKLLSDYMQGKISRDWHITEWRVGIREGIAVYYEYIGALGCTEENYKSIFAGLIFDFPLCLIMDDYPFVLDGKRGTKMRDFFCKE